MDAPLVSVIMPVHNEAGFIGRSLGAVLAQEWPDDRLEVILVDGASTDETITEVASTVGAELPVGARVRVSGRSTEVLLLTNPRQITPISLNIALAHAQGDYIVRVDGHCVIRPDYVRNCVETLMRTGYEMVGGAWTTESSNEGARAIAAAQTSRFGVGNIAYRVGQTTPSLVDTVPFGAWPRRVFDEVGLFDEELVRNQDDEFAFRIQQAGGRILFDPSISSRYFSRTSFRRLWRQYFDYGLYKVRVAQKRGGFASPRHLVPAAFVTAVIITSALGGLTRRRWLAMSVIGPYALANGVVARTVARREHVSWPAVAATFTILHAGYGVGFLNGVWRFRRHFVKR